MRKTGKLLALLLCVAMLFTLLAACGGKGGETEEPDGEPFDIETEPEDTNTPSPENTKELEIGVRYDAGFVMDLPEGFRFNDGWSCYETDEVQAWIRDIDFYEYDHNLQDVLDMAGVTGDGEPLGPFTYWSREAEEFYGPSTHYYIDFNGLYPEWAGCHVLFSSPKGDVSATQTPELVEALKTIRKKGEAVGEQGGGAAAAQPEGENGETAQEPQGSPFETLNLWYDGVQAGEMSAFMNYGRYAVSGNALVGLGFTTAVEPALVRMDLKANGDFADIDSYQILDTCEPTYVSIHDDMVYYVRDWGGICRVPLQGGEPECVVTGPAEYVMIRGDKLYYCNEDYRYCRADLDGHGEEVLFDKEVYYPYMLDEEWLVYQDDADGESLHLRHLPTGADARLTDTATNTPILYGSDLFAIVIDEDCYLAKIDLASVRVEYDEDAEEYSVTFDVEQGENAIHYDLALTADGYIYVGKENGDHVQYWDRVENELGATGLLYVYSGADYEVYWRFMDGNIAAIYVTLRAGGGSQSIPLFE